MPAVSVSVQHLTKRFGNRATLPALDQVSFGAHGGVVTLLGPNGAGKTSLLRCLATVIDPSSGALFFDGLDPLHPDQRTQIRRRLGYLPQEPRFAGNATVFDVLDYLGIVKDQRPPRRRHAEVLRVLRDVGLAEQMGAKVKTLSGGMVRRVGIAQALLGRPGLVLLDEPAAGLDPEQRLLLRERLSQLGEHSTVIMSTHLTDEAAAFSQSLLVMHAGRIIYAGTPGGLTLTARGRVWLSPSPDVGAGARLSWRTPDGWYRAVGDPPSGAHLGEPTLEDAYLLLVGAA